MSHRLLSAAVVTAAALGLGAAPAGAYDFPKPGAWKVIPSFDYTVGPGTFKIAANGKAITAIKLTIGPDYAEVCGGTKVVLKRKLKLRRTGESRRPAFGKLDRKTTIIDFKTAKVSVDGVVRKGAKAVFLFDENGKIVDRAAIYLNDTCTVSFNARKR